MEIYNDFSVILQKITIGKRYCNLSKLKETIVRLKKVDCFKDSRFSLKLGL